MKWIKFVSFAATLVTLGAIQATSASADAGGVPNSASCNPGNASFCVPEVGAAGAPGAFALVAGATLLLADRRRKRAGN